MAAPLDSFVEIVTPENISFRYEIAGPFRRLPALLVDFAIRIAIFAVGLFLVASIAILAPPSEHYLIALGLISWFGLEWLYGGCFEWWWNGQTPGKHLMGLRVLGIDGRPIQAGQAVLRNLLRTADLMPLTPLVVLDGEGSMWLPTCMVGLVCMAASPRYQRLGDLVCGTMVVVEDRMSGVRVVIAATPQLNALVRVIPSHFRPNRRLSRAIAVYVDRRGQFSAARREDIARHLSAPLVTAWGLPATTNHDLLLCAIHTRLFAESPEGKEKVA